MFFGSYLLYEVVGFLDIALYVSSKVYVIFVFLLRILDQFQEEQKLHIDFSKLGVLFKVHDSQGLLVIDPEIFVLFDDGFFDILNLLGHSGEVYLLVGDHF